ncbi:hypothetical protein U9M48_039921 [Paspalum notatum var. saurae]|uniref:Uncharacterized protein n=1 Tax=Paspalum notatum var. saurae TaxID=547442 RepID=A0AAQ3UKM0_PASNO
MTGDKKDDGAPTIEDCVLLSDMNAFQENVKSWITEGAKKTNKTLGTITQTLVSLTDRMDAIEKRHPAPTKREMSPQPATKRAPPKMTMMRKRIWTKRKRKEKLNSNDDYAFDFNTTGLVWERRSCGDANLGAAGAVSAAAAPSHPGKRGQRLLPLSGNLHHHHHLRRHHVQQ